MRILVYCQHVLGIGHLCRTMLILRELRNQQVTLVLGGPPVTLVLPEHVQLVQLPGLLMDEEFSGLLPVDENQDLETVKEQRSRQLQTLFKEIQPDLLLLELFPFGRNAFRFELLPLLKLTEDQGQCRVVCSVRDILVDRDNTIKFEQRVIDRLNRYFHLLLIHGDPDLIRLDATFSRMRDITIPITYTGYICEPPRPEDRQRLRHHLQLREQDGEQLLLVSAGSGSVGFSLLLASIRAFALLESTPPCTMQIFSGPYLPEQDFQEILRLCAQVKRADRTINLERFTTDFPAWLAAADLSLSMGGYNTTLNLVAANCPALVFPFAQNQEQQMRAARLQQRGLLRILTDQDLQTERLAPILSRSLKDSRPRCDRLMLDGARQTAELLVADKRPCPNGTTDKRRHRTMKIEATP